MTAVDNPIMERPNRLDSVCERNPTEIMPGKVKTRFECRGARCSLAVFWLFVLFDVIGGASCLVDYCSTNTFQSNSTWLQFTKEVSSTEYAVVKKFKSLHCCAKGYRSIEWYKDERAYPWPGGESTFILYPEAANQTIYTQVAAESDRGNYTCLMRNDTHIHFHTVMLALVEKPPPAPRATFTPVDQWVELGYPARFYCEAFVGRINLPDAQSDVSWRRVHPEGSSHRLNRLQQDKVTREDEQILGAYLMISELRSDDYGQYVCKVGNADSYIEMPVWLHHKLTEPNIQFMNMTVPWKILFIVAIAIWLAVVTAFVLYARFGQRLILRWRTFSSSRNTSSIDDDKEYDVLMLYTEQNAPFTLGMFIPTLQNKYLYRCINYQLPNNVTQWHSTGSNLSRLSRSIIAVISPSQQTSLQLTTALTQLHQLATNIPLTVVLLQDLPKIEPTVKDSNGENLLTILKKTKLLILRHMEDKNFWLNLQLSLPNKMLP